MGAPIDLTSQRFRRLVVLGIARRGRGVIWLCRCDCGGQREVSTRSLRAGQVKDCGCFKHGISGSKLDSVYQQMVARCHSPNNKNFPHYGGRGIAVCDEWRENRPAFFKWALTHGYSEGLTIERKDNGRGYCPDNCTWATRREQANNTRRNTRLSWNGRTQTATQWARELGIKPSAILERHQSGWSVERIFTQPFREAA